MEKFTKSYTINITKNYKLARINPSKTSFNAGDLAEISFAENFGIVQDMHRQEKRADLEPDLIINNIKYQVKSLNASIKLTKSIENYIDTCACDLFAIVLKNNKDNNYKVYELNKKQMLNLLQQDSLCYNCKASASNGGKLQRRLRTSFNNFVKWLEQ